jgi:hypothetical protein
VDEERRDCRVVELVVPLDVEAVTLVVVGGDVTLGSHLSQVLGRSGLADQLLR